MSQITLQPINSDNWLPCVRLTVADDQTGFVATNAKSLAQAAYQTDGFDWQPRAIYDGETMVGFVMYGVVKHEGKLVWDVIRLMIDQNHQGKGYGSAALLAVLHIMRSDPRPIPDVYISFVPQNTAARHIYAKLGFTDIGFNTDGSEVLMHMTLT